MKIYFFALLLVVACASCNEGSSSGQPGFFVGLWHSLTFPFAAVGWIGREPYCVQPSMAYDLGFVTPVVLVFVENLSIFLRSFKNRRERS